MKGEFRWPNGERMAVAVTIMLESWSEGVAPPMSVQASSKKAGTLDRSAIAWGTYGGKTGIWRLINLLNQHGIRGTFGVNALSAELYPDAVKQIAKCGHEICGHAYAQDKLLSYMEPDEERDTIRRSLQILESASGQRPKGWVSPVMGYTDHTRQFLIDEGMIWHGDGRDVDMPRLVQHNGKPIVHIPMSDFTDHRVLKANTTDLWDVYRETFDYLYLREAPNFLAISLHCHFGGRPLVAAVYDKIFRYLKQHPDVWFANYGQIAEWISSQGYAPETYGRRVLTAG
jgi:peptidoglycan/xylan/chitin deacetylase (PgdA/CDA1 family)